MDAITGFVYGMSMMFFSMMAWMFWRKGSDRLFRLIMILMLIVDAQCLKDILSFYFIGFDNEENWFLISAADMFIIPFYSFVLMELVKPGWTTWRKAVMLELPFVLLPAIYCVTGNNIYFYILAVWGAVYGLTTFIVMFFLIRRYHRQLKERFNPKLKLSDVARMVGTNRTYLSRFFNEENGQTFYDFVNNYRVEHATQLLRTSSYTVLEVAEKSGFNSVSTFRRAFVAAHECSPNEYRAQM